MRNVGDVTREKKTYNVTREELKSGAWLALVPDDGDILELTYKNNYLTIIKVQIKTAERPTGEDHGTE